MSFIHSRAYTNFIIAVYNKLVKTQINTKSAHCLQVKFVIAISREPIAQSSQSLLYSTRLDLPQGLVASICSISSHIPVPKNWHQNSFLAHCAVDFSRINSSIVSISFIFDLPRSTAGPGGFNLSNFFTYPCSQNWHQNSFLAHCAVDFSRTTGSIFSRFLQSVFMT